MCRQWLYGKRKIKPGLPAAFAQTWSSLSRAFFPMPLHQSWAGTEHFQLVLSFFKMSAFIHFAFNFFFQSPTEMDCQLKVFHIIPFWQNSLINKVFYIKNQPSVISLLSYVIIF